MKVLLIYPPRRADTYFFPPTSLLYIASAIRAIGHEAQIIDIPYLLEKFPGKFRLLDNSLLDYILQQDFDVLGLGGVVSTYFFYDDFVKRIRDVRKKLPIVVGGSVGVPIKDVWLNHAPVDFLIEGEGEIAIQKLLDYLEGKCCIQEVAGLHYLKDGRYESNVPRPTSNLDNIPFISYDEVDHEYYINELTKWAEDIIPDRSSLKEDRIRLLPLLTSRGCPFSCTFCFHFNNNHRYHSTKYVIENIRFLKRKYGVNCFYIIDDLFNCDRNRTIELCESIHRENLGVRFVSGGGKPSLITEEMLRSMKKAGFIRFSYGIESGSQKMLNVMKKGTTVEQNLNAIRLTKRVGIPMVANMVFGMPGENLQTLEETKKFIINANLSTKQFYGSWATAYPGAPLFDYMKRTNMVPDTREYLLNIGSFGYYKYNLSEFPSDMLMRKVIQMQQDIDTVYYWRNGHYGMAFIKYIESILRHAYQFLKRTLFAVISDHRKDDLRRIKTVVYYSLRKINIGAQKRNVKLSNLEIEKWIENVRRQESVAVK